MTPKDHPGWARRLNYLAKQLGEQYERTREKVAIQEAVDILIRVVKTIPKDHPDWAQCFDNLGIQLSRRNLRTKLLDDLDDAVEIARQAAITKPEKYPEHSMQLEKLVNRLGARYERSGAISDVEEAIELARKLVNLTPKNDASRPSRLATLGKSLSHRYSSLGAIIDLDDAVDVLRQAVDTASAEDSQQALYQSNLGCLLRNKYLRTGEMIDLVEAIQSTKQAIEITANDHPNLPKFLYNLGIQLGDQYFKTEEISQLDEAIAVIRKAVDMTPKGHPDQAMRLEVLACHIGSRYSRTREITDYEESIQVMNRAIEATPEDHSDWARRSNCMGNLLCAGDPKTDCGIYRDEAISWFRHALKLSNAPTIERLKAGRAILDISPEWQEAYEAGRHAVDLIPTLTSRSLGHSDKQNKLGEIVGLASDAAAAALEVGQAPIVALNLLEQGRGVIGAASEEMRADILELKDKSQDLAEQFSRLQDELEHPMSRKTLLDQDGISREDQMSRRYDAEKNFNQLVAEIRKLPGLEEFLSPPGEAEIHTAAEYGPIAVINVSTFRCDALLVERHQIRNLPLNTLTKEDIENKAKAGNIGSLQVLEWLWDTVARPVLDALGYIQTPSDHRWPHIWWITTGTLSNFPLHASGRHRKYSQESVLDSVMSSYASSIKAIVQTRRRRTPPASSDKALLVAMEQTPGIDARLPFAAEEISILHRLCESMSLNPIKPTPLKQNVISHLRDCKIFHFAGHGHVDPFDPSKSYLLLEDWEQNALSVADLIELNLRGCTPFVAYLSACSTGRIEAERFLDESIHLISACQLAGFRHVIGTLWDVNDRFCLDIAKITYEAMRDGGMTDESVCLGLHDASRQLRDRWLDGQLISRGKDNSTTGAGSADMPMTSRSKGDREDTRLLRDADLDDYGDEGIGPLDWAPYVHFGV